MSEQSSAGNQVLKWEECRPHEQYRPIELSKTGLQVGAVTVLSVGSEQRDCPKHLAFAKDGVSLLTMDGTRQFEMNIRDRPIFALVPRFHVERAAFLLVYQVPYANIKSNDYRAVLGRLPVTDGKARGHAGVAISAQWSLTQAIKRKWNPRGSADLSLRNLVFLSDQRHFVTFHAQWVFQWCLETENECFPILSASILKKQLVYGTWNNTLIKNSLIFSLEGETNLYVLDISSALMFGSEDLSEEGQSTGPTIYHVCRLKIHLDQGLGTPFWWDFVQGDGKWWMVCLSKAREEKKQEEKARQMVKCHVSLYSVDTRSEITFKRKCSVTLPMGIKEQELPEMSSNVCKILLDNKKIHCIIATDPGDASEVLFHISTVTFDTNEMEKPVQVSQARISETDGCDNPYVYRDQLRAERLLPYVNILKYEETMWSELLVLARQPGQTGEYTLVHVHGRKDEHK